MGKTGSLSCCYKANTPVSEDHHDTNITTVKPKPPEGFWDRFKKRVHWIQPVTGTSMACTGVLTGVTILVDYLTYNSNWPVFGISIGTGVVTGGATVVQLLGLIYLCAWKPQKEFEKEVKEMGELSNETQNTIKNLNDQILNLTNQNKQFETDLSNERILSKQRLDTINLDITKIQTLTTDIDTVKKSVEVYKELVVKWQDAAKSVAKSISTLKVQDIGKTIPGLEDLKKTQINIDKDTNDFKEVRIDIENSNSELKTMIDQIHSGYTTFVQDIQKKQDLLEQVTQEVNTLKESTQSLTDENLKLQKLANQTEQLQKDYSAVNIQLQQVLPTITLLTSFTVEQLEVITTLSKLPTDKREELFKNLTKLIPKE